MNRGRSISAPAAVVVLSGCLVVVPGMSLATATPRPATPAPATLLAATATAAVTAVTTPVGSTATMTSVAARPVPASRTASPSSATPSTPAARTASAPRQPTPATTHDRATTALRGGTLPLPFRTHHARQVITVVAHRAGSTTAVLQAWRRTRSGGWLRRGPQIKAWVGAQGMTKHPSESKSATPTGSFTLTRAFGRDANPGTALPYLHTKPSDWWISQAGPLYNTHQRCSSNCPFTQGSPNEHLYYETPYYNYAVVIDYNTRNAPGGVRQGAGSAFFLHVHPAGTGPTSGCVSIPQRRLVPIMRWLRPRKHPRILIGTA